MRQFWLLLKPASSSCNLRCQYCFYHDEAQNRTVFSHGKMTKENTEILLRRIQQIIDKDGHLHIAFQGGEPTLMGLEWFTWFVDEVEQICHHVHWTIQTNGTLIDEQWCQLFLEHHFLVGVSLDGFASNMDKFRFDPLGKSVYYKVLAACDLLRQYGVEFNILTVVTHQLSKHGKGLYAFYKDHHFMDVQLIPCLPSLDEQDDGVSLRAVEYIEFFKEIWKCIHLDTQRNQQPVRVNIFENILSMFVYGQPPYQCGYIGHCGIHQIVESNLDVYPCDFYCLDQYRLGNLQDTDFQTLRTNEVARKFLMDESCMKKPCMTCPYVKICHGACRRQNCCFLSDQQCGYQQVLNDVLKDVR